ncbi:DUF4132 domain-containing protein [Micromonospora sp. NBC_01655]|uniref:DUF4132 domain-containing protein n=1 Tax=Micromonospora sp. NBC_01655 TaxID=2975983 RepID=UPI00225A2A45|nr:DUF4132 domain-containing protein [Micromonospora sp. NBC_01655]MCX4468912.1 DUF4132 domain-containing protein [Micromonospora sp. NBC_01655]
MVDVPGMYADAVRDERDALWRLVDQARGLAKTGDLAGLRDLAGEVRRRLATGDSLDRTGGHLGANMADISAALDDVYDGAFPVRDPDDPAEVLDAPWPSVRRAAMLASAVDRVGWPTPPLEPLAERAIAANDVRLLRLLVLTPLGRAGRETVVRIMDALHAAGALDVEVIEKAFADDAYLGRAIGGEPRAGGAGASTPAGCAPVVRDHFDALAWRLTSPPEPDWDELPEVLVPRGLRFALRALDRPHDRRMAERFGPAELTDDERSALVEHLRDRTAEERRYAFELRLPAGDAEVLLPVLGLPGAVPLLRLVLATAATEAVRQDRAAILAAVRQAGDDGARRLLELCPSEVVAAALGWNRAAVEKRVKRNALSGIAAFGLLPLAGGETVLDRYLALREVAKRGPRLGPNRRHSHAAAVAVALDHLAQVAGLPDADRLEWDCEARIATEAPGDWRIADYTVGVRLADADPVLTVSRAGRTLKSVPATVRADPRYADVREHQERLRDQARRMRIGMIERLVATGGTLTPDELLRLRRLPAGRAMLPALIWQDRAGTVGLLDQIALDGPVTAAHPFLLYERRLLAHWQAELVRRRIRQPVKQAFRELYLLTPAERDAVDVSRRFAGHPVDGRVAGQLLSGRGWSTHGGYDEHQATRPVTAELTAALACELHGYFGGGDVVVGELRFLAAGSVVPLAEVPPVAFSEVMRDLDLVVSVAGTEPHGYASPPHAASRAQLLAALIDDLGLARVTVDGASAVVRGSRATYRVHLNSGSIHVEPGGYLCVVPASFGDTAHRSLFLPFADEDRMTSVILSKVLLLNEDEKITDPAILAQLDVPA